MIQKYYEDIIEDFRKCFDVVQKMDALFPDMKGAFTGSVSERLERHWNRMVEENNKETKK